MNTLLRLSITLSVPVLLVMGAVRLLMTPLYLQLEYNRPGFPVDMYGFTTDERLHYAPLALEYLLNGEGIDFLGRLTFSDGSPLYNERELQHMVDVKVVVTAAFGLAVLLGGWALIAGALLWRRDRVQMYRALFDGGVLTISLLVSLVLLAAVAWDFFFTAFHDLFFADGTWLFLYSDTLIRLFPEQFWFDAALVIGVIAVMGAVCLIALSRRARSVLNPLTLQNRSATL